MKAAGRLQRDGGVRLIVVKLGPQRFHANDHLDLLPDDRQPDRHFAFAAVAPGVVGDELDAGRFPTWLVQRAVHAVPLVGAKQHVAVDRGHAAEEVRAVAGFQV